MRINSFIPMLIIGLPIIIGLAACGTSAPVSTPPGRLVPVAYNTEALDRKLHQVGEEESIQAGVVVPLLEFDNLPGEWGESCMQGTRRVAKQTDWYNIGEICAPEFHGVYQLGNGKKGDVWITVRPLIATRPVTPQTVKNFQLGFINEILQGLNTPAAMVKAPFAEELLDLGHTAYYAAFDAMWATGNGDYVRRFYGGYYVFVNERSIVAFTFEYRATNEGIPLDFHTFVEATLAGLRFID
ncbi:MAG: hypothetical protein HY457_02370 [Parcubacteria group bacterium]|nr:hypothetical protein [Parcubacteria group bacterium]